MAYLSEGTSPQKQSGMARVLEGLHSFHLHTNAFINEWNEPYLPLPSQPKLVLLLTLERWQAELP